MDRKTSCTLVAHEVAVSHKTGTLYTSVVHILTAMVGAGVLAMPQALGNLGWLAGPAVVIVFYAISMLAAQLLASVFEVNGVQHPRYYEAVGHILGRKAEIAAAACQLSNIFLVCIAYTITAGISMTAIANLACGLPAESVSAGDGCFNEKWIMSAIFGGSQVLFVQLPNIESSWIISTMGALTALAYSSITLGLCIAKVAQGNHHGTLGGIPNSSGVDKAFNVLSSLGSIGFAYSFSQILLEVQDTIREPPKSERTMKKACRVGLTIGAGFYGAVSVFGYLGLGDEVPGDVLIAFDSPKALIVTTHCLVVLHMVAAYNVFAQTFFLTLEGYISRLLGIRHPAEKAALEAAAAALATTGPVGALAAAPTATAADGKVEPIPEEYTKVVDDELTATSPFHQPHSAGALSEGSMRRRGSAASRDLEALQSQGSIIHAIASISEGRVSGIAGPYRMSAGLRCKDEARRGRAMAMSLVVRSLYAVVTTVVAVVMPFFSEITGLIGSLIFWPLTIFFPFMMYMKVYQPARRTVVGLYVIMGFMFVVAAGATVGSLRNIITSWSTFTFV